MPVNIGAKIQAKIDMDTMEWLHFDPVGQRLLRVLGELEGWNCCG